MHRLLAFGYALTIATLIASVEIARGVLPFLDEMTAFLASQFVCLALIPAALSVLAGTKRSQGKFRRILGYLVFCLDILLAGGACLVIVVSVATHAHVDPV